MTEPGREQIELGGIRAARRRLHVPDLGEIAPELGKRLFGVLFVVDGIAVALAESLYDRRLQPPRRALSSSLGYGLLLALGALGFGMFGLMFATVVFGLGT